MQGSEPRAAMKPSSLGTEGISRKTYEKWSLIRGNWEISSNVNRVSLLFLSTVAKVDGPALLNFEINWS